jgi:hypothetical protein
MGNKESISFEAGGQFPIDQLKNFSKIGQKGEGGGRYYLHIQKNKDGSYTASVKLLTLLECCSRKLFGASPETHLDKIVDLLYSADVKIVQDKNSSQTSPAIEQINQLMLAKKNLQKKGQSKTVTTPVSLPIGLPKTAVPPPSAQPTVTPKTTVQEAQKPAQVVQVQKPVEEKKVEVPPPQTGGQTTAVSQPVVPPTAPQQPSAQPAVVSQPTTESPKVKQQEQEKKTVEEKKVEIPSPQTGGQSMAGSQPVVPPTTPPSHQPPAQPAVVPQPTKAQEVSKTTQVAQVGRTTDENYKKLEAEFEKGVFIRTVSDYEDEVEKTIKDKKKAELDPKYVEARTWASTSVIQKECPCEVWSGGGQTRCGLLLSSETQLGGFNVVDMTTENVPDTVKNPQERLNYFPNHMPTIPTIQLAGLIQDNSEKGNEIVRKLLGLKNDVAIDIPKREEAMEFILEGDNKEKLTKLLPQEYHTVYTMKEVTSKMENIKKERKANPKLGPAPYGEAKVRYMPKDILGIYVQENPQSKATGLLLQEHLKKLNIDVPVLSYDSNKGQLKRLL